MSISFAASKMIRFYISSQRFILDAINESINEFNGWNFQFDTLKHSSIFSSSSLYCFLVHDLLVLEPFNLKFGFSPLELDFIDWQIITKLVTTFCRLKVTSTELVNYFNCKSHWKVFPCISFLKECERVLLRCYQ